MQSMLFHHLGKFIYRFRVIIFSIWALLVICCLPIIPHLMDPFQNTGFVDEQSSSAKASRYLDKKLGYGDNRFVIIYYSKELQVSNPEYINKIKLSLAGLKNFPVKHQIIFPDMNKQQISSDKHTAYVVVLFDAKTSGDTEWLSAFEHQVKTPDKMTVRLGGEPIFLDGVNQQTQKDLFHADFIAAPIATIVLVLVFGSISAAIVPIVLCGGCALMILTTLYFLGHVLSLSIFTINIALLLGICLSLDYSLFMISRFREELNQGGDYSDAIANTMATAGKAVFFSGLAVFVSLTALLLFPVNILFSVGVGGLTAVFMAMLISIIVLPSVLAILNTRINFLPINLRVLFKPRPVNAWRTMAAAVVKRPLLFFISALIVLLLLGSPFLAVRPGVSDLHILPSHSDSMRFFDAYKKKFNEHELTPIQLIVTAKTGDILSSKHIGELYDLTHKLQKNNLINQVNSIVTLDPSLTKEQYKALYAKSAHTNPNIKSFLKTSTRKQFTVISIVSNHSVNSPETQTLITQLNHMHHGKGISIQVTGVPVTNADVLHKISHLFPYALAWIIGLTYLILLLLLRSLFLPFKAILMNILSLSATYGVLVFIFQEGHLHQLLNFNPQGILDVSLLVIIFCALFGFSMDYEVFLLTRIQESYKKCRNNDQSIIYGIEHSSRIITSAAIIVIVTCGSFMVAEVLMVKEFGLGIAVAIFVDAFIVRSIFVPATMALVKEWNWYLPKWLDRVLPKI